MRQGMVYMNGIPAGVLTEVSPTEYLFRYEDAYYADAAMPAVSLTLPKTQQEYWSPYLFSFFSNMLSEGTQSRRAVPVAAYRRERPFRHSIGNGADRCRRSCNR